MINKKKETEWHFCYWDEPEFNNTKKTNNDGTTSNTSREKDFNKTKES